MRRNLSLFVCLLLLLLTIPQNASAAVTASDEVRTTVDSVLSVLKEKNTSATERRTKIRDLVRSRFDFELMSQSTLGQQWRKASPEEKKTFIELYSQLLEATYVGRIEAYTNETVRYGDEKLRGGKALVETNIVTSTVEIPINYKMVQDKDGWKVYDVVIEGVSLIRNFRSSYGSIIDSEGFKGLFERMRAKIAELEKDKGTGVQ